MNSGKARAFARRLLALFKSRAPAQAIVAAVSAQALVVVVNLATGIITARTLGPAGRGLFTAVTAWPLFMAVVSTAGVGSAIVYVARAQSSNADVAASVGLWLSAALSFAGFGIALVAIPVALGGQPAHVQWIALVCSLSIIPSGIHLATKQALAAGRYFPEANLVGLLPTGIYFTLLVTLLVLGQMSWQAAAFCLLGSTILSSSLAVLILGLRYDLSIRRPDIWKLTIVYAGRAFGYDAVNAVSGNIDKLVLLRYVTIRDLGLYAVAYGASRIIQVVNPAISSVLLPSILMHDTRVSARLNALTVRWTVATLFPLCVVILPVSSQLLAEVYGDEFASSAVLFDLLLFEAAISSVCNAVAQFYFSQNRPGLVSVINAFVGVATVGAMTLIVPGFGVIGAAFVLLSGSVAKLVLFYFGTWVVLRTRPPGLVISKADIVDLVRRFS